MMSHRVSGNGEGPGIRDHRVEQLVSFLWRRLSHVRRCRALVLHYDRDHAAVAAVAQKAAGRRPECVGRLARSHDTLCEAEEPPRSVKLLELKRSSRHRLQQRQDQSRKTNHHFVQLLLAVTQMRPPNLVQLSGACERGVCGSGTGQRSAEAVTLLPSCSIVFFEALRPYHLFFAVLASKTKHAGLFPCLQDDIGVLSTGWPGEADAGHGLRCADLDRRSPALCNEAHACVPRRRIWS